MIILIIITALICLDLYLFTRSYKSVKKASQEYIKAINESIEILNNE